MARASVSLVTALFAAARVQAASSVNRWWMCSSIKSVVGGGAGLLAVVGLAGIAGLLGGGLGLVSFLDSLDSLLLLLALLLVDLVYFRTLSSQSELRLSSEPSVINKEVSKVICKTLLINSTKYFIYHTSKFEVTYYYSTEWSN